MIAYFDNAATTAVYDEVKNYMIDFLDKDYGNPSSMHAKGFRAELCIKEATENIAKELKCQPKELVFTSGGTEANNLAIIGTALGYRRLGRHIITTRIEHASVLEPMKFLKKEGFNITYIDVDENGIVKQDDLKNALREDTILVSIMYVNNEIGSIQPIKELAKLVKNYRSSILFHVDAVQAFGKLDCVPKRLGVDLLSMSGHKIHGPKGSGALYIKENSLVRPILYGGGQQQGMRSGTENVPAIVGFGLAAKMMYQDNDKKMSYIRALKERFLEKVLKLDDVYDNSGEAPHIASVSFPGVRSEVMLHKLEEYSIFVSAGSACSSNKRSTSGVLKAIGLPQERLESTLRFSFSDFNTEEQVDYVVKAIEEVLPKLRRYIRK